MHTAAHSLKDNFKDSHDAKYRDDNDNRTGQHLAKNNSSLLLKDSFIRISIQPYWLLLFDAPCMLIKILYLFALRIW